MISCLSELWPQFRHTRCGNLRETLLNININTRSFSVRHRRKLDALYLNEANIHGNPNTSFEVTDVKWATTSLYLAEDLPLVSGGVYRSELATGGGEGAE